VNDADIAAGSETRYEGLPAVTTESRLAELIGTPSPVALEKERGELHELDVRWLAATTLCFVATSAADGTCDVSPKGDPAGFVKVLDNHTIALPERSGNRRADGYRNILENPHVGMTFLVPGRGDTLRINGTARLVTDGPFFDNMIVKGHRPVLAMMVTVEQVFYHCPKAFLRSQVWAPETWEPGTPPAAALIAQTLTGTRRAQPLEEIDADLTRLNAASMYPAPRPTAR
jgi:PPOX class probable FMN-dependent enzyme